MDDRSGNRGDDEGMARRPLEEVIGRCQGERRDYYAQGTPGSPWCMELFRRAFAEDQEAWQALSATFERLVRTWIGAQRNVEHDDVLQETFLAFARYAPRHPDLVAGDDLARVLGFLRRCTKSALLTLLRQQHADALLEASDGVTYIPDDVEVREAVRGRLHVLLETEEERDVFHWRFECDMKPRQIVERYGRQFADVAAVYDIVHRITRRLRSDPVIRELYGLPPIARRKSDSSASLEIRLNDSDGDATMPEAPCRLSEALLLAYVMGDAPAEVRQAIEQAPACVRAAQQIARDLLPLMRGFYRLGCPDVETLVAYQEHRLASTQHLVLHAHVEGCDLCRAECAALAAIDAVPLDPPPGRLRRLVEALFQPPLALAQPVRGELLHYQAPDVSISLSMRKTRGQPRTWTLRGQVRTPDGMLAADRVEAVVLRPLDPPDVAERQGTLEAQGTFVFKGLPAGMYSLSILMAEEEVVIRQLAVGDEG